MGEKFGISGGVDYRNVLDEDDENTFNRNYYRTYLSLDVNNFVLPESRAAFTVEYWNTKGIDHSTDLSVDFYKKFGKFDINVGTSYSLYKFNFVDSRDREVLLNPEFAEDIEQKVNVRTYYLKLKYLLTDHSDVSMRWLTEVSDTEPGTFHQLLLSYTMNF